MVADTPWRERRYAGSLLSLVWSVTFRRSHPYRMYVCLFYVRMHFCV